MSDGWGFSRNPWQCVVNVQRGPSAGVARSAWLLVYCFCADVTVLWAAYDVLFLMICCADVKCDRWLGCLTCAYRTGLLQGANVWRCVDGCLLQGGQMLTTDNVQRWSCFVSCAHRKCGSVALWSLPVVEYRVDALLAEC